MVFISFLVKATNFRFSERKKEAERQRQIEEREKAERRSRSSRFDQTTPLQQQQSPHKIPSLFAQISGPPAAGGQQPSNGPQIGECQTNFPTPQRRKVDLVPKAPYYELPAGMMVPLIKPEEITVRYFKNSLRFTKSYLFVSVFSTKRCERRT